MHTYLNCIEHSKVEWDDSTAIWHNNKCRHNTEWIWNTNDPVFIFHTHGCRSDVSWCHLSAILHTYSSTQYAMQQAEVGWRTTFQYRLRLMGVDIDCSIYLCHLIYTNCVTQVWEIFHRTSTQPTWCIYTGDRKFIINLTWQWAVWFPNAV